MTDFNEFDIIASVPLYKRKEKERGYNQAALLSRELSRLTGIPTKAGVLERIRDTGVKACLIKRTGILM
jgi:predicted amidophosphoribosyltransferase